ncbi:MAG: hypothetical protein H6831_10605 [Planctomycetes bacterium]|nr:hypothetical protein [Planctomycetota bacterium]
MGRFVLAHLLACIAFGLAHFAVGMLMSARCAVSDGYEVLIVFGSGIIFLVALVVGMPASVALRYMAERTGVGLGMAAIVGATYGAGIGLTLDLSMTALAEDGLGLPAFTISCGSATALAAVVFIWFVRMTKGPKLV